jgi:alpha-beta hydrolase superfamily lysophospholipase
LETSGEVKRVLLGLHGAGGHSGGFLFLGNRLAEEQGTDFYAIDRRGFGNSVEKGFERGNVSNFKRYLQDIDETCNLLRTDNPGKKFFIYGHSEGAILALKYAAAYPGSVDGLILTAPGIKPKAKPPTSLVVRVLFLHAFSPNTLIDSLKYTPKRAKREQRGKVDDGRPPGNP